MIILLVLFHPVAQAQDETNYAVHANIIYHFTKYIDWPEYKKTGDFIIGIVGESPLLEALKISLKDKTVGKQKIVIRQFSASADAFNCHILFLSVEESTRIKKLASITSTTATLLVSESEGLARKGSCINFTIVNEKLKLEINKTNVEKRGLSIATELLQLGTTVN
jgi:hypothetical protein